MSSCLTADMSDHLTDLELDHGEQSSLVSAESGPRDVYATRVGVRDGRVVFEKDERMWVYRSYPIAIGPRPGAATGLRVPAWTTRATLVEPHDLAICDQFKDCSAVYAIGPAVVGWWESAPFTLRKSDRIVFDRLETSILSMPLGCEVETLGYLRDAGADKQVRKVTDPKTGRTTEVNLRSALMMDPLRLAPAHVTGRRSRARGEAVDDSGERWHWGIVPNLEDTLDQLLEDPELDRFRESVMDPEGDFLARWYRAANDTIPVPQRPIERWENDEKLRWLLTEDERDPRLIEELLREAARYALAGPIDLGSYQRKCQAWAQTGRRKALHGDGAALVFPLVQNIFVDWLVNRHNRGIYTGTAKRKKSKPGVLEHMDAAGFQRELLDMRNQAALLTPDEFGKRITDAVESLRRRPQDGAADEGEEEGENDESMDGHPYLMAIQTMAASIAWMEDRLLALDRHLHLSAGERRYLNRLKAYWGSR